MRDHHRIAGWLMVALSLAYLWTFVSRGWVPHDEGMLGQSAERFLLGQMPHVNYEEPYTGGLTLVHAAAFRIFGIDLLHLRWVLFAAAAIGQFVLYAILRRFLAPVGAAFAAFLALTWSFPNYFASLPSWWVLLCAVGCLWAFIRYTETDSLGHAALAGFAAGLAIAFKQTGLYLLVALAMAFLYGRGPRAVRAIVAMAGLGLATFVLRSRLVSTDSLYLLLPIAACALLFVAAETHESSGHLRSTFMALACALVCAALPLAAGAVPYVASGHVGTLVDGLFVLPQKRLQFASLAMARPYFILAGVPCALLISPLANRIRLTPSQTRIAVVALSVVAAVVITASFYRSLPYQLVWQSGRGFAALLPVVVSWLLARSDEDSGQGRIVFAAAAMLAWASLVQFPFSGAIYFCYTVPLAVIAGAIAARHFSTPGNPPLVVWCAALMVFAVLTMNRGYLDNLGAWHERIALDRTLDLPRAHLDVKAEEVSTYQRVNELVGLHIGNGELVAGPDAPEVYFLAGRLNPSGVLFDFFSGGLSGDEEGAWADARVVVLNHRPGFSPKPSESVSANVRAAFPHAESVGKFEVRWR